jgi:hypothetical protein
VKIRRPVARVASPPENCGAKATSLQYRILALSAGSRAAPAFSYNPLVFHIFSMFDAMVNALLRSRKRFVHQLRKL